jgi:hypothetical protein
MMGKINCGNVVKYRIAGKTDIGIVHKINGQGKDCYYEGVSINGFNWTTDDVSFIAHSLTAYLRGDKRVAEFA